jgi:hypothetical protein
MNGYLIAVCIMLVMFVGLMIRLLQEPIDEPEPATTTRGKRLPAEPIASPKTANDGESGVAGRPLTTHDVSDELADKPSSHDELVADDQLDDISTTATSAAVAEPPVNPELPAIECVNANDPDDRTNVIPTDSNAIDTGEPADADLDTDDT